MSPPPTVSKGFILWLVGSYQNVLSRGVTKSDRFERDRSDSQEGTSTGSGGLEGDFCRSLGGRWW